MGKIGKLYIEPSSLCNLNCKMCFRNNWFDERVGLMSKDTVRELMKILKSDIYESAFFGGMGEPLMCADIYDMISAVSDLGRRAELITNATLLDLEASKRLISSGLDTLWVSMDGFSKESYEWVRRGSLYEKIVKNLTEFRALTSTVKLGFTFVMMRENLGELKKINAFADRFGADFINLSHAVPGDAVKPSEVTYDLPYRVGKMHRYDKSETVPKELDFCPFVHGKNCFIRSDGEVCACMQLLHNSYTYLYEERRRVFAYSFGNINEMSLSDIWASEKFTAFRQRALSFDFPCCTVCLGCEDRKENLKDCMYNDSPTCGACLWAQGLIRCP